MVLIVSGQYLLVPLSRELVLDATRFLPITVLSNVSFHYLLVSPSALCLRDVLVTSNNIYLTIFV